MRNPVNLQLTALGAVAIVVGGLLSACSPVAAEVPTPAIARSASSCSSMWTVAPEHARVEYKNISTQALTIKVFNVDCFDWDGDENPKQFDGAALTTGQGTGMRSLAMRPIPESGGVIRPWNLHVCVEESCGELSPRFEYRAAEIVCQTTRRGQTPCLGESLCTGDPELEVVVSKALLKRNDVAFGEVTATTNCFISTKQTVVTLDWKEY